MNAVELSRAVGMLLRRKHMTLSVCESCTGGMLGSIITAIPGSSHYFFGGVIAYADRMKRQVGVKAATLKKYGAVSEHTAREMAKGVRMMCRSDIGMSITGVAGPTGGSDTKPVGSVYFGLATSQDCQVVCKKFRGSRNTVRSKACRHALSMLYTVLQS